MKSRNIKKKASIKPQDTADSESRWRSIFENMKDTVMTVNRKAIILSVNHVQQGFTRAHVIGRSVFDFVSPEKIGFFKKNIAQLIKTGNSFEVEDYILGPDGSVAWYYSIYSPILDSTGYVKEFMIITRNITTMKQAEHIVLSAMFDGQEAERKRVSSELHDGLGQNISAIRLNLLQLEEKYRAINKGKVDKTFLNMRNLVVKASDEVRSISLNLAPPRLDEFGLLTAIIDFCQQVSYNHPLVVKFKPLNLIGRLEIAIETSVYRIIQELVTNVIKHAAATKCDVSVSVKDNTLKVQVSDNGKGYNTAKKNKGLGLQNIQARVKVHKGKVAVSSAPAKGTSVTVELPLFKGV